LAPRRLGYLGGSGTDKIGKAIGGAMSTTRSTEAEAAARRAGSANIRKKFGVVQDESVHRYVTLVGAVLARVSKKPDYTWRFIVLDTDAVNAFAAPGGYVHITKGCLALVANESELAGVLGHELTHVVEDHTIKALSKAGFVDTAASASGKGGEITAGLVNQVTSIALQGSAAARSWSPIARAQPRRRPATSRTGCARSCSA
jgi:predicted Zn-dependent protease